MKKLLFLLSLLLTPLAANAQSSKAAIISNINVDFADNNAGNITAALLRTVTSQIVTSYVDWLTCATSGGMVYWNSMASPTCLPAGLPGQILQTGTPPSWVANVSNLMIASSSIISGTNTRILYDNAGVLGEYSITGTTSSVVMQTSPSLITPALGIATATSLAISGATIGSNALALNGHVLIEGVTSTGATGTGNLVFSAGPTFTGTVTMPDSSTWTSGGINSVVAIGSGAAAPTAGFATTQVISATSTDGFLLANPTAATAGAQKLSPRLHFTGSGWKTNATAAAQTVDWIAEIQPVQSTTSTLNSLVWSAQTAGGGYLPWWSVNVGGTTPIANSFIIGAPGNLLNLMPANDGSGTLGSATFRWGNMFGFGNLTLNGAASTVSTALLTATGLTNTATTSAVCYNTGTGVLTYDGTLGTCTVSDERLKNMGERIPNSLEKLLQINGVYGTWKDQSMGTGRQIFIGAQTAERVFPELVQTDSDGKKSLDYQRLTAPIIEGLRELNARLERLERRAN